MDMHKRLQEVLLHEQGNFATIGSDFAELDVGFACTPEMAIAWNFWEGWIDECNHDFAGFYKGITREDWPVYARYLVERLARQEAIGDPVLLHCFDFSKSSSRQGLLAWLKRLFKR